jgi:hypothetical protein
VVTLTNVTAAVQELPLPLSDLSVSRVLWRDILRDRHIRADNGILRVSLDAYEVVWLKPSHG